MKKRKRNIILTIVAIVLVGLGIWTYIRWNVWFGNPPEAPYTPSKTPSRVLLTFGNDGEKVVHAYRFKEDTLQVHDMKSSYPKKYEDRLKSLIQQYMHRMNNNQLVFKK